MNYAAPSRTSKPIVLTQPRPIADIQELWSGQAMYDPAKIMAPTLLIRGEWDSRCTDVDAAHLMAKLGTTTRRDVRITRATHLMHLEEQRDELHAQVNRFLAEVAQPSRPSKAWAQTSKGRSS